MNLWRCFYVSLHVEPCITDRIIIAMKSILTSLFVATLLIACAKKDEQTTEKTDVMPPLTQAEQNELFEQAGALFPALPAIMPGGESDSPELG